jgi:opacity protein-like surface antigen
MKRALLITLCLSALVAGNALAQSDLGLKAVGGAVGFVSPEDLDGTVTFGVFANHGTIVPNLGLESRLDFWSASDKAFGVKLTVRDVALGARAKYYFPLENSSLHPFAGGGLALHFIHAEVDYSYPNPTFSADDSSTKLGLDLGGGVAMPMNDQWDFSGELWYGIVSDVGQFSLRAAFAYKLGS